MGRWLLLLFLSQPIAVCPEPTEILTRLAELGLGEVPETLAVRVEPTAEGSRVLLIDEGGGLLAEKEIIGGSCAERLEIAAVFVASWLLECEEPGLPGLALPQRSESDPAPPVSPSAAAPAPQMTVEPRQHLTRLELQTGLLASVTPARSLGLQLALDVGLGATHRWAAAVALEGWTEGTRAVSEGTLGWRHHALGLGARYRLIERRVLFDARAEVLLGLSQVRAESEGIETRWTGFMPGATLALRLGWSSQLAPWLDVSWTERLRPVTAALRGSPVRHAISPHELRLGLGLSWSWSQP